MKYIAIFDLPEGYKMGCAVGKMISAEARKKEVYSEEDFENTYARVERLTEEKSEIFEKFNAVIRIMYELGVNCAWDMPSFWCNKGKDYKVINTKYHQGYMQALDDVEKEVRRRFGFEMFDGIPMPPPHGTNERRKEITMADLIDREILKGAMRMGLKLSQKTDLELLEQTLYSIIDALPPAERTSEWEYIGPEEQVLQRTVIGGLSLLLRYRCKNCGYLSFSESNYCPECGKRMEVDNG